MKRILSFHGFNFVLLLGIGFTTDCICAFTALDNLQQEIIRDNHCARQAQRNPARHNKNPWKNKSVASGLSVIDFERGERAKGEWAHQWGTVFQTALPYFLNTRDFVPGFIRHGGTAVWKTVPHWCAHSPLARSPRSKSITDNADATDLFFSRIFIVSCWICRRLLGAMIVTDYLLLKAIQRRIGANAIRVRFATEFFLTRIYRIDADA